MDRWVYLSTWFEVLTVRVVEDKRVQAVTKEHITEHPARIEAAMKRYRIREARFVFNLDQSGTSIARITGRRSMRKGIGHVGHKLIQANFGTKGNLQHITVMSVVSADESTNQQLFFLVSIFAIDAEMA